MSTQNEIDKIDAAMDHLIDLTGSSVDRVLDAYTFTGTAIEQAMSAGFHGVADRLRGLQRQLNEVAETLAGVCDHWQTQASRAEVADDACREQLRASVSAMLGPVDDTRSTLEAVVDRLHTIEATFQECLRGARPGPICSHLRTTRRQVSVAAATCEAASTLISREMSRSALSVRLDRILPNTRALILVNTLFWVTAIIVSIWLPRPVRLAVPWIFAAIHLCLVNRHIRESRAGALSVTVVDGSDRYEVESVEELDAVLDALDATCEAPTAVTVDRGGETSLVIELDNEPVDSIRVSRDDGLSDPVDMSEPRKTIRGFAITGRLPRRLRKIEIHPQPEPA